MGSIMLSFPIDSIISDRENQVASDAWNGSMCAKIGSNVVVRTQEVTIPALGRFELFELINEALRDLYGSLREGHDNES